MRLGFRSSAWSFSGEEEHERANRRHVQVLGSAPACPSPFPWCSKHRHPRSLGLTHLADVLISEKRDWIAGGGEMGALVRSLDWSTTALGPLDAWTQSLRTTVGTCIHSRFPVVIFWAPSWW